MATPLAIVAYLALFAVTGFLFLFANLVVGLLVRPQPPNEEKLEVYECGEPTIGSSFVQFDLRFYVVALLFIIFDVEVAFFFPWATVFGKATQLASDNLPVLASDVDPAGSSNEFSPAAAARLRELGITDTAMPKLSDEAAAQLGVANNEPARNRAAIHRTASALALASFADIAAFFAVLAGWFRLRVETRRLGLGAGGGSTTGSARASPPGHASARTESIDSVGLAVLISFPQTSATSSHARPSISSISSKPSSATRSPARTWRTSIRGSKSRRTACSRFAAICATSRRSRSTI